MKNYSVILFDLDGTLTDSGPGIMKGFEYAIQKMGDVVTDRAQLRRFIGPALEDSFGRVLGYSPEDTKKAIVFYREYYFDQGGVFENDVYPGIEELLTALKKAGKKLAVATSKNERGTRLVLEHFGLDKYFDVIATSNDTDRRTKANVIRYALSQCDTSKDNAIMVGDRHYDIGAANEIEMDSIGVIWGYGDRAELEAAGASFIVQRPEEVFDLVMGDSMAENKESDYPLSRMRNPFMEYNGIEICEVSPEHSVLKATLTENSRNPYGMVHGGMLYTMMDCVAGITARADNHNYVTQSVYVNYLSNIKDGDEIYAEGTVTKRGNTITIVHAIVRTADGKQLADGTIDMFRLPG